MPDVTWWIGKHRSVQVSFLNADGTATDTTGWIITSTMRTSAGHATVRATKTSANPGEIDAVGSESTGVWVINWLPADTTQPDGKYVYDVAYLKPSGFKDVADIFSFELRVPATR